MIDNNMQRLVHLGILKQEMSPYPPIMFIARTNSDLKDAYRTTKLSYSSKPYCGILPYCHSASYVH